MGRIEYIDTPDAPCVLGPADEVVELHDDGRRAWAHFKSWAELRQWVRRERSLLHYVGGRHQPGVHAWANDMETRYFWPPGSPRNAQYRVHQGFWEGILWLVVSIPAKLDRFADRCAARASLTVRDAIPMIAEVRADGEVAHSWFPIKDPAIRVLDYADPTIPLAILAHGYDVVMDAQDRYVNTNTLAAVRASRSN